MQTCGGLRDALVGGRERQPHMLREERPVIAALSGKQKPSATITAVEGFLRIPAVLPCPQACRKLRAACRSTRPGFVCVSGQSLFIYVPCKLGSAESWTPQPCAMQPRASDEIELGAATCRCSRTMYWLPSKDRWEYKTNALWIA